MACCCIYFEGECEFWLCATLHVDPVDIAEILETSRNVKNSICKLPLNGVPMFSAQYDHSYSGLCEHLHTMRMMIWLVLREQKITRV